MAKRGPKVRPRSLSLVKAGKQSDPAPGAHTPNPNRKIIPPDPLAHTQQKIWDEYINPAWWLQQNDALLAYIFVNLMAEFMDSPERMVAARIGELRKSMAELHLSSSEQARLGMNTGKHDPAEEFFDD